MHYPHKQHHSRIPQMIMLSRVNSTVFNLLVSLPCSVKNTFHFLYTFKNEAFCEVTTADAASWCILFNVCREDKTFFSHFVRTCFESYFREQYSLKRKAQKMKTEIDWLLWDWNIIGHIQHTFYAYLHKKRNQNQKQPSSGLKMHKFFFLI